MAYVVWKVAIPTSATEIEVPGDAELLTARDQGDDLCIWFKCNPANPLRSRRIHVVGTGYEAPSGARYVGTGMFLGGRLVLHVFEN